MGIIAISRVDRIAVVINPGDLIARCDFIKFCLAYPGVCIHIILTDIGNAKNRIVTGLVIDAVAGGVGVGSWTGNFLSFIMVINITF